MSTIGKSLVTCLRIPAIFNLTLCKMLQVIFLDSYYDADQSNYVTGKYHGKEDAHIDNVKLCGTLHNYIPRRACITFRISVSRISV